MIKEELEPSQSSASDRKSEPQNQRRVTTQQVTSESTAMLENSITMLEEQLSKEQATNKQQLEAKYNQKFNLQPTQQV